MENTLNTVPSDIAPFAPSTAGMAAKVEQDMQKRFLQHFESVGFETAIEPDHAEWLETPTHKHTLRFNVCERVASKMNKREADVWLGGQVDRGRSILQRLGMEITDKPRVIQSELNPHEMALEYDVDMQVKDGPVKPHESLPALAQTLKDAAKYYYNARKDALNERGENYVEPTAIGR